MSFPEDFLNSLVPPSSRDYSFPKKKINNLINSETEYIKFSTFNKGQKYNQELDKSIKKHSSKKQSKGLND